MTIRKLDDEWLEETREVKQKYNKTNLEARKVELQTELTTINSLLGEFEDEE